MFVSSKFHQNHNTTLRTCFIHCLTAKQELKCILIHWRSSCTRAMTLLGVFPFPPPTYLSTYPLQCVLLMFVASKSADDHCYELNTAGRFDGHCGRNSGTGSYRQCSKEYVVITLVIIITSLHIMWSTATLLSGLRWFTIDWVKTIMI